MLSDPGHARWWWVVQLFAVLWCAAAIVLVASVELSGLAQGVGALVTGAASLVVYPRLRDAAAWVTDGNLRGRRSSVASLVSCDAARAEVGSRAYVDPGDSATATASARLVEYLAARFAGQAGGFPLVIVTGADEGAIDRVVRAACASFGSQLTCMRPISAAVFKQWFDDGAGEDELPRKRKRDPHVAWLFLLGNIESYRKDGLEARHFDAWGQSTRRQLAVASAVRSTAASRAADEWRSEWFRVAEVVDVPSRLVESRHS